MSSINNKYFAGDLLKFTNAFQGWQRRWCVIDPDNHELRYYLKQENWEEGQKPRGSFQLIGAQILSSDDDLLTFTISHASSSSGSEICCKLKASDLKSKEQWMDRLRVVAAQQQQRRASIKGHDDQILAIKSFGDEQQQSTSNNNFPTTTTTTATSGKVSLTENVRRGLAKEGEMFQNLHKIYNAYADQHRHLNRMVDTLEIKRQEGCLDPSILALKANANLLASCFDQCVRSLKDLQGYCHQPYSRKSTEDVTTKIKRHK